MSRLTGDDGSADQPLQPGLSAGRSTVSRSEVERPLLSPVKSAASGRQQLVFAAGFRPLRKKLRFDEREPFRSRAA